jgi:hypothetical protein
MLKLISSEAAPTTEKRIVRMRLEARVLAVLKTAEIKRYYDQIEFIRDQLSQLLDRADGKQI